MLPLRCTTQSYDWGIPASQDSKVLSLARANGVDAAVNNKEAETRFAELWVGTHSSGGASVLTKPGQAGLPLESWLEHHPEALGTTLAERRPTGQPEGRLPFLMKVLSIDRALPLQAHPTNSTAKWLHEKDPQTYPDAVHKPEMAIALNNFVAFAGFLAFDKMAQLLGRAPELARVLGDSNVQDYLAAGPGNTPARQKALAGMFQHLLLQTPQDVASETFNAVLKRLTAQQQGSGAAVLPAGSQTAAAVAASGEGAGSSASQPAAVTEHNTQGGRAAAEAGPSVKVATTGTSSQQALDESAALSGSGQSGRACDLALAMGIVSEPGGLGCRDAMLAAAAAAWPNDPAGALVLLLMEDIVLQKGECVLIPAGCPHAYICGEILEIQAASNNTIKGGLTSDPLDRQSLVDIVTAGLAPSSSSQTPNTSIPQVPPSGTPGDTMSGDASDTSTPAMFEGVPPFINPMLPGGSLPEGFVEGLRLYQPGFGVEEFQTWHIVAQAGQKAIGMVMDPGPGTLLVLSGAGHCTVKAGVVVDENLVDEVELHPGVSLFIPAGSSLSFQGTSTTEALDAWITTANSRMFTAAPPAGAAQTAEDQQGDMVTADAEGKAGAAASMAGRGIDPGNTFTAAEQVAAAVMAGAAGGRHLQDSAMETD